MNLKANIKQLRQQIIEFNKQYEIGKPIVEDYVYDFYKKKLSILEEELKYKISEQIGAPPVEKKAKHLKRVLSLQHDFGKQSFDIFITRIKKTVEPFPLVAELKVDGVSVIARYEAGLLKRIATRGNGTYGEDITHLAKFLHIPNEIYLKETLELRFEAFIEKAVINNPRNAVAGLLLKKAPDANLKYIRFMPHNLYTPPSQPGLWQSYIQLREIFQKMHLDLLPEYKLCNNIKEMEDFFDEIEAKKDSFPFEIDGVVFKINDYEACQLLGETEYAPRYAFAVKFENAFAITTILDIVFQVGRFGNITPVAEIEETTIKGRKIKRATLNNIDMLKEKKYAKQDFVKIEMAGEVIPMITDIVEKSGGETAIPKFCPSCNSALEDDVCTQGWNCSEQKKERLCYFASKHGLDIKGMGEKQITFFIEMDILKYPYDFFEIKNRINKITYNPTWLGPKALSNLLEAIEKSRYNTMEAFYVSVGILHIGRAKAKLLAMNFPYFADFLNSSVEQLQFLGPEIAKEVYKFKQQSWIEKTWQYMRIGQEYKDENIISLF